MRHARSFTAGSFTLSAISFAILARAYVKWFAPYIMNAKPQAFRLAFGDSLPLTKSSGEFLLQAMILSSA
jgi:hypothetical protein